MEMNADRFLVDIVKEIAREEDIELTSFSYDWIIRLTKGSIHKHIMGYDFELNSSTAQVIAKDKSATSDLLIYNEVPCVEHKLFMAPQNMMYVGVTGNWKEIIAYSKKHKYNVVCKTNVGTGGNDVIHTKNQYELENAVHELFTKHRAISLSPFYKIDNEYRIFLLNYEPLLIYSKKKPVITGDGKTTVFGLLGTSFEEDDLVRIFKELDENSGIPLSQVLKKGRKIELSWKHNLGKGSKPVLIKSGDLRNKLSKLAVSAAKAINIQFASIDIVEIEHEYRVLEINSGIMMEAFSKFAENGYLIAKGLYKKAILEMLK